MSGDDITMIKCKKTTRDALNKMRVDIGAKSVDEVLVQLIGNAEKSDKQLYLAYTLLLTQVDQAKEILAGAGTIAPEPTSTPVTKAPEPTQAAVDPFDEDTTGDAASIEEY